MLYISADCVNCQLMVKKGKLETLSEMVKMITSNLNHEQKVGQSLH